MKRFIIGALAAACAAALVTGCNEKSGKTRIGIIQYAEHPALDANYHGFVDGLKEAGFVDGQNIAIDYQNAQAEQANCVTIANKFVNDGDDLIFAITTPAAQAVATLTTRIPILVSSVTDPESAKLVKSNKMPGTNVTGTSDLTPVAEQIQLLKKLVPDARRVGLLFCSSEANSIFQIEIAKEECMKNGLLFEEGAVSNSNEIQQVAQSLVGKVDAFYVPTDNMIAAGMANVVMVANDAGLPVICGEDGMVKAGGLATYGIDYYQLGRQTAKMAVEVIRDGKNPAEMPVQYYTDKCKLSFNSKTAETLGIKIPEDLD